MSAKRIEHIWHIFRGEKKNFRFLFCDIGISKRMQGSSKDFFFGHKVNERKKKQQFLRIGNRLTSHHPKNWLRLKCFRSCTKTTTQPTYLISFSSNVPTHILHTLYHRSLPTNKPTMARATQQILRFNALTDCFEQTFHNAK